MGSSWIESVAVFKSPLRVVVRFLRQSRDLKAGQCRALKKELKQANRTLGKCRLELEKKSMTITQMACRIRELKDAARNRPPRLPDDPPIGTHGYGARMVCLAVALARAVGFRGAERVLTIVFEWLGVEQKVPNFTTIRLWFLRVGLAIAREPLEPADDRVWLVDHSNQIGPEKVLCVLGVRASRLPPIGTTMNHEDVEVLTVQPGTSWKKADVARVYEELAERHGTPRAVLGDGAAELREAAEALKTRRSDLLVLHDFKHKAASLFKALVGKEPRFQEFNARLGQTRCSIQQTELAHLTPPSLKQKARFMNLGSQLEWAGTVLALLEHPEAESRRWTTPERLEDKLGWLREFADDLAAWRECQQVINAGLRRINEQGVFRGTAERFRSSVRELNHELSQRLAEQLIEFLGETERSLETDERLPLSTEILESSFALYKQLERQHSQGGFTSLLAGFPTLLRAPTEELIRAGFAAVSTRDVKQWVRDNLGTTLTSKRLATYREMQNTVARATNFATST